MRPRILDAARQLFAERGFAGAATRDIARLAEVNQGLITYHFGGKEALFREVVERELAELQQRLTDDPAGGAPLARWLAALGQHRQLVQLLVHALLEPGPRRDWVCERLAPLAAQLRALLAPDSAIAGARSEVWLLTLAAATGAIAAFGPALVAARERSLDVATATAIQHELLETWLAGGRASAAGPWSARRVS